MLNPLRRLAATTAALAPRPAAASASLAARFQSTDAAAAAAAAAAPAQPAAATAAAPPTPAAKPMTWAEYLAERKSMRLRNQVFTFVGSPLSFFGASMYFAASYEFDPTEQLLGIESPFVVGGAAVALGAIAATMTPTTLEATWRMFNSAKAKKMDVLDKEFYRRIQKHRADASLASPGGIQLYDYYGQTVTSFAAYRKWLRKQRKIKEKATFKLGARDTDLSLDAFDPVKQIEMAEKLSGSKKQ
ncbi:TIM23 complex component [Blastocladiella emersonii ATCC 22665]|nr:TIM23 complex component [Blastocladiella emersonii ATCC 22665]